MKKSLPFFVAALFLFVSSCHRPVAYFQRTPHAVSRLPVELPVQSAPEPVVDYFYADNQAAELISESDQPVIASLKNQPQGTESTNARIEQRMRRVQTMLPASPETIDKQPRPKPKPKSKLRLGNRIRQELGVPLREELTWWQRISWKLKASVVVILLAVVFAILHIPILPIVFGLLGAFLLVTGLKKSFKVRRPWF